MRMTWKSNWISTYHQMFLKAQKEQSSSSTVGAWLLEAVKPSNTRDGCWVSQCNQEGLSFFSLTSTPDSTLGSDLIFISADYRLLLPSTGLDIIEDVKTLFTFLASSEFSLTNLPSGVTLDHTRLAVVGESGGGKQFIEHLFLSFSLNSYET